MKVLKFVLLVAVVLNTGSFALVRGWQQLICCETVTLKHVILPGKCDPKRLSVLHAGNLAQGEMAFDSMKTALSGHTIYVQFENTGWNARATAKQIAAYVRENSFTEVDFYGISLGDHVARYLETELNDMEELRIFPINPCTTMACVAQPLKALLPISVLFEGACYGLGWLSTIPVIPVPGGKYSLALLADQYWEITFDKAPRNIEHTKYVIFSKLNDNEDAGDVKDTDGVINNTVTRKYFEGVPSIDIPTGHGDTIGAGAEYLKGLQTVLREVETITSQY